MCDIKFETDGDQKLNWLYEILDSLHEFFILKNPNGVTIFLNKKLINFLGYAESDTNGNFNKFLRDVLHYSEIKEGGNLYKIGLKSKYGIKFYFNMTCNYINNSQNEKIGMIGFLKLTEDYSKSCFNFFKNRFQMIELLDIGIVIIDRDFNIEYLNESACSLLKVNYIEAVGKKINDILKRLNHDISVEDIMIKDRKVFYAINSNDEKFLSIEKGNMFDGSSCSIIIKDVTQNVKMDRIMEQTEKYNIMGELTASMIHEIKNSLTPIKGFIKILQTKYKDDQIYFESINSEVDRIIELTKEYLSIAKKEDSSNKIILKDVIEEYMTVIEAEAAHRNIEIIKRYNATPAVNIDPNHIKQLLLNIFQNAFQAINKNGTIILVTKFNPVTNKVIIKIADDGYGIERENLKRIMMPFYTTKKEGTGLGLPICKRILETYNGSLKILSKKGKGTIINIYLNVAIPNN
ncbi:MAG: ATP-binding protein [Thermoanaerobacteraceae bacterium]|nr:ATP-binding protein [Thermoanaerobacteraceae bacterium]